LVPDPSILGRLLLAHVEVSDPTFRRTCKFGLILGRIFFLGQTLNLGSLQLPDCFDDEDDERDKDANKLGVNVTKLFFLITKDEA
jgi:hypothetical protein